MDLQQYELVLRLLSAQFDHRTSISFSEAAKALSYASANAAYISRRRKTFPLRVDKNGGLKVAVAELARYLTTGEPASREAQSLKRGPGRPSKKETIRNRPWSHSK